ncbi:oligopeptide ABC transporter permease OppB [Marinomonas sp. C2222]|uniref:Oligopeptide ABC transporter permease OppB n=1 Tax=Marinomonas sargassi TaxID=2984494 RepID=A0ABT2YV29_9GAMM|nr:oligopeptide ABC transporter permease OppB [Marinomonas sargassi]MCV2403762.1 oligopeptide ABC transporter permease OppB [Marinomonas sargassi]
MFSFIVRRIGSSIPTMLILILISFALMRLAPGSPFSSDRGLPPEVLANLELKYGLNLPWFEQLFVYLKGIIFDFDFGPSFKYTDKSVNDILAQGFPVTLTYGIWSFVAAVAVGLPLGIVAAVRHNTKLDYAAVGFSIGAQVLPNFVMAPILVIIFTLWLNWLPGGGWNGGQWQYVVMPILALSTSYMASIARITRSSMLEVLHANFIRTAKAKGVPMRNIILRHALKPALLPVISYLGPAFVYMITGSVIIDIYFSTGGMGQFFVDAALNRDYSLLMGVTIVFGVMTIVFNTLVDITYAWLDPKIRL